MMEIGKRTIQTYKRQTNYYETDQMGVIHHSNYIRFFEEARMDFMEQAGFGYSKMEHLGIMSPVVSVSCDYKKVIHFSEIIIISTKLVLFNGIKMNLAYQIKNEKTDDICTIGESKHCFVNQNFQPISLKKLYPDIYQLFLGYIEN